jgi:putative membrane protein
MRRALGVLAAVPAWSAAPAWAHEAGRTSEAALAWTFDPAVVICLVVGGVLYGRGLARLRRAPTEPTRLSSAAIAAFAAGWLTLVLALMSPLHALGAFLFSAHMVQHELLMLVAAPLIVLGRAPLVLRAGMPAAARRPLARLGRRSLPRRLGTLLVLPLVAWSVHTVVLWGWHVPALFDATQRSDLVHALQHASFFGAALLFWWVVLEPTRAQHELLVRFGVVFTTSVHGAILGALLTVARTAWYVPYAATTTAYGLSPLEDQQLGGLVMWVPAGLVYVGAALALGAAYLRRGSPASRRIWERRDPRRPLANDAAVPSR